MPKGRWSMRAIGLLLAAVLIYAAGRAVYERATEGPLALEHLERSERRHGIEVVRADLHRQGLVFPSYSHRGYIETEGLAAMAHDMGVQCWGMPGLRIVHGNH